VSEAVRDDWLPVLARRGVGGERVHVIHSGVPKEYLEEMDDAGRRRLKSSIDATGHVVASVGRLSKNKHVDRVLEAFVAIKKAVAGAVLVVLGDGPERAPLERLATELGVGESVRFLGARSDVRQWLLATDVLMFASRREGFGLVVIEALAAGAGVVSHRLPSLYVLERLGAGVRFVDAASADELAAATIDLLCDAPGRRERRARGREIVSEHFTAERTARRYEDVYRRVLRDSPP
jgi:glycosyltransferase involved in cell wall biosynthesis